MRLSLLLLALVLPASAAAAPPRSYGFDLDQGRFMHLGMTHGQDLPGHWWRCGARRGSRYPGLTRAQLTFLEWAVVLGMPDIPLTAIPEAAGDVAALRDRRGWIDPDLPIPNYYIDGAALSYVATFAFDFVNAVVVTDLPPAESLPEDCTGPEPEAEGLIPTSGGGTPAGGDDVAADGGQTPVGDGRTPGDPPAGPDALGPDEPGPAPAKPAAPAEPEGAPGSAAGQPSLRDTLACMGALPAPPRTDPIDDATLDWLAWRARCDGDERTAKEIAAHLCAIGYPCPGPWDSPQEARDFLGKSWAEALRWLTELARG